MTLNCPDCSGYLYQQTPVTDGRVMEDRTVYGCLCCGHKMLELPTAPADVPSVTNEIRAAAVGVVGEVHGVGAGGSAGASEAVSPVPPVLHVGGWIKVGDQPGREICGSCDAGLPMNCTCQQPWCGHCDGGKPPMYCTCVQPPSEVAP